MRLNEDGLLRLYCNDFPEQNDRSYRRISLGFVATDIRGHALAGNGQALGQSPRNEDQGTMSIEDCVRHIVAAMESRKRDHIMTLKGKVIPWAKLIAPGLVDRVAAYAARTTQD